MINNDKLDLTSLRIELQAKLLLESRKDGRASGVGRCFLIPASARALLLIFQHKVVAAGQLGSIYDCPPDELG